MVFLKLMIICLVFVNVSSDQCKERPSLSFIVCNTEDQCDNSVTLSEVFDVLEACEKPSSCESSHRYGSICCNLTCYDFVEIIFGSDYLLRDNYTLVNIDNILFTSLAKEKFTIRCMHDYDENTGFTFIAIRNLTIENLNIIECGTKHVSTSQVEVGEFVMFSSAVVIQNSTDVLLNNIIISDSNGIGLSIIDTNGIVEITNSEFSNNTAETRSNITGGGGIYIEFTKCTPGVTNCNPASNLFNHNSIFSIQNCSFECNDAINNNTRFDIAADTYVIFGYGGGLLLFYFGEARNNILFINSTNFVSNKANNGGGLSINGRQNVSDNQVYITDCVFQENFAITFEGGGASIGFTIHQTGGKAMHNTFVVQDCRFVQNEAPNGAGGGLSWYGSNEPSEPTNSFKISNSTFVGNKAQFGFAMQINKDFFYFISNGSVLILVVADCNFTGNGVMDLESLEFLSQNRSVGTVAASGIGIQFKGSTIFSSNHQTALVIDRQKVEFYKDSVTVFEDNNGLNGGAILLISGAWIEAYPNSRVAFFDNTALISGAAIYVELTTPFDHVLSHSCFIRYSDETITVDKWNTSFVFCSNLTNEHSEIIFATTLRPCQHAYSNYMIMNERPFCFRQHDEYGISNCFNDASKFIATSPAEFCNTSNETNIHVVPGKVEDLNICIIDELGNKITGTQFRAACIESPLIIYKHYDELFVEPPHVLPTYQFTSRSIQIAGRPNTTCRLQLQTIGDFQITRFFNVLLLNCPPGFFFNNASSQCECLTTHRNHNPAISSCEHFQAYVNPLYWIGYESDDTADLLMGRCPLEYCYRGNPSNMVIPSDVVDKNSLDHFVCNPSHRTGRLCSQCIEGYSVAINSPTFACEECKDNYKWGILYLFLSYVIPVSILFYIIMAYDIRLTTGIIGAFLFFAQIVGSNYHSHLVYSVNINNPSTLDTSNVLYALYSISNLVFFNHDIFSFCLFKKAGTADIKAFELLLSFYPVLLIITYFLMRKYCHCLLGSACLNRWRFSNSAISHGVCGFLILCFVRITLLAFALLIPQEIFSQYANKTGKTVVYLQGDMEYFKDFPHTLYGVGSLLILVVVIAIPTLILLLHPIMIKIVSVFGWGDSRVVLLINKCLFVNKLKPIIDSFQGDYKDDFRCFAGLQIFLYKIVFFLIVTVTTPEVTLSLLLLTVFMIVVTLVHILVMPFKRDVDNAVYSMIYTLLLGILVVELYTISTGKFINEIIWLLIILSSIPLNCFILYCTWRLVLAFHSYCSNSTPTREPHEETPLLELAGNRNHDNN